VNFAAVAIVSWPHEAFFVAVEVVTELLDAVATAGLPPVQPLAVVFTVVLTPAAGVFVSPGTQVTVPTIFVHL
jgi:hypothetical protein